MSSSPPTLVALQVFLRPQTGLSPVSLGIVGDARHDDGYHLGRDRIFSPAGKKDEDYSVKTARDRRGLSTRASAMDIGSFRRLREMSIWLVRQARADAPDTHDIREIIYSPDGIRVLRWDRERGVTSRPRQGEADSSHRTHTHISWYRDSETRDKTALFARFFRTAVTSAAVASEDDTPQGFDTPRVPSICTVRKGVRLFTGSDLRTVAFTVDPGRDMPFLGEPIRGVAIIHRTDERGRPTGKAFYARTADLANVRPAGP